MDTASQPRHQLGDNAVDNVIQVPIQGEITRAIFERDQILAEFERFKADVQQHLDGPVSQLQLFLEEASEIKSRFLKIQIDVEFENRNINLDAQKGVRLKFEKEYKELVPKIKEYANHNSAQLTSDRIDLPKFNGNVAELLSFINAFKGTNNDCLTGNPKENQIVAASAPIALPLPEDAKVDVRTPTQCTLCDGKHFLFKCAKFLKATPDERKGYAVKAHVCFNCLKAGHTTTECRMLPCKYCERKHNTLLHFDVNRTDDRENASFSPSASDRCTGQEKHFSPTLTNENGSKDKQKRKIDAPAAASLPEKTKGDAKSVPQCTLCDSKHYLFQCEKFMKASPKDRKELATKAHACFNCLKTGHTISDCRGGACKTCQKKHNTLLHFGDSQLGDNSNSSHFPNASNRTDEDVHKKKRKAVHLDSAASLSPKKLKVDEKVDKQCTLCDRKHYLYKCAIFHNATPKDRKEFASKARVCLNCLKAGHSTGKCNAGSCKTCQKKHNSLLHFDVNEADDQAKYNRSSVREAMCSNDSGSKHKQKRKIVASASAVGLLPKKAKVDAKTGPQCMLCDRKHLLFQCEKFMKASPADRKKLAAQARVCFNCLQAGHSINECRGGGCKKCQKKHNTLLHFAVSQSRDQAIRVEPSFLGDVQNETESREVFPWHESYAPKSEFREMCVGNADYEMRLRRIQNSHTNGDLSSPNGSELGMRVSDPGFGTHGLGFASHGPGFGPQGSGFGMQRPGFGPQGSEFGPHGIEYTPYEPGFGPNGSGFGTYDQGHRPYGWSP